MSAKGYRLQIEPGSLTLLPRPISMAHPPNGSKNPFVHPEGLRYLQSRPRRFVSLSDRQSPARETQLEVRTVEQWLQETAEASRTTEGVRQPAEARLVTEYAEWRRAQAGRAVLVRHRLYPPDGTELLSDAFDVLNKVMLEAKATTDRPAIRMAIGQLLDYARWDPKGAQLAILLPRMPSDDLIDLAQSVGIEAVWQRPDRTFNDSAGGALTH